MHTARRRRPLDVLSREEEDEEEEEEDDEDGLPVGSMAQSGD